MMVSSRAYPLLKCPKQGPVAMRTPQFPTACPCCKAARVSLARGDKGDDHATYACGGEYSLDFSLSAGSTNHYSGYCVSK